VQQPPEGALVVLVLVDVRDAQLGLPQKRVVRTLEDLPLLGDRRHDGLQRRAPIHVAEASTLDLAHDLPDAAPDRAEVLQALFPQEPGAVRRMGIGLPTVDQGVPLRGRRTSARRLVPWPASLAPSRVAPARPRAARTGHVERLQRLPVDPDDIVINRSGSGRSRPRTVMSFPAASQGTRRCQSREARTLKKEH
jgi:hypothetical protein